MRRNEFEINDINIILELLAQCEYGTLSLLDDGLAYGVPVNFAWWEEGIVFHGSKEGKKMQLIAQNPNASFNAVKPYAYIPSYFSGTRSACPATQFFGSVTMRGVIKIMDDVHEKASALNALMEKLQPEKRYESISSDNPIYTTMLEKTAVLYLKAENLTCKVKVGQNLTSAQIEGMIAQLAQRGKEGDATTIELIRRFHD